MKAKRLLATERKPPLRFLQPAGRALSMAARTIMLCLCIGSRYLTLDTAVLLCCVTLAELHLSHQRLALARCCCSLSPSLLHSHQCGFDTVLRKPAASRIACMCPHRISAWDTENRITLRRLDELTTWKNATLNPFGS